MENVGSASGRGRSNVLDLDYRPPAEPTELGEDYYITFDGWIITICERTGVLLGEEKAYWEVQITPKDGPDGYSATAYSTEEEAQATFRKFVHRNMMDYLATPTELQEDNDV